MTRMSDYPHGVGAAVAPGFASLTRIGLASTHRSLPAERRPTSFGGRPSSQRGGDISAMAPSMAMKEHGVSLLREPHRRSPAGAQRGARFLLVLLAAVLLTACSDDDPQAAPSTTTRATAPTSTTTIEAQDPVESEITERYKRFWQARFEANQVPPNPDLPALRDLATGEQLDKVVAETRRNAQDGLALRRPEPSVARSSVKIVKVDGGTATLQECVVDDGVVYRVTTGEVVDAKVATHNVEATMKRIDGAWRLAAARLVQRWEGVAGCAVSEDF